MSIFKNLFLFNKKPEKNNRLNSELIDQYKEIAEVVKEARIKQNLTLQELSLISKIPEQTINSIEKNNKNIRPKYPFIRLIKVKLISYFTKLRRQSTHFSNIPFMTL